MDDAVRILHGEASSVSFTSPQTMHRFFVVLNPPSFEYTAPTFLH
jgi:hypothetical protein